ncbi:hypothetical protein N431DRAFT_457711 [Stipitochalara longipes BDJ]|nr:hypothetical protein N431DRAFT_457711 [Stipitochalara longipes BDJ]
MPNGEYFIAKSLRPQHHRSVRTNWRKFMNSLRIVKVGNEQYMPAHTHIGHDLNLELTKINGLFMVEPGDVFRSDMLRTLNAAALRQEGYLNLGIWKPSSISTKVNLWISRQDLPQLVFWYLDFPLSPKGILYNTTEDIVVKLVFKTENLKQTLETAKKWVSKLDVNDEELQKIQSAMNTVLKLVSELDPAKVAWSRSIMHAFYALDAAISDVCKTDNWIWKSVSVLYAYDEQFRFRLGSSMEKIEEDEHRIIKFDIQNGRIIVPDWEHLPGSHKFDFNFETTFADTRLSPILADSEMSFAQAAFASLQRHLRTIMWKISLNPKGLLTLVGRENTRILISTLQILVGSTVGHESRLHRAASSESLEMDRISSTRSSVVEAETIERDQSSGPPQEDDALRQKPRDIPPQPPPPASFIPFQLANLYMRQGKLDEAEDLLLQTLSRSEEELGPKASLSIVALDHLYTLGRRYADQGKLHEAERIYLQALKGFKAAHGLKHPSTIATLHSLGIAYTKQGRISEAENMYKQALFGRNEGLGPDREVTFDDAGSLGSLDQGVDANAKDSKAARKVVTIEREYLNEGGGGIAATTSATDEKVEAESKVAEGGTPQQVAEAEAIERLATG